MPDPQDKLRLARIDQLTDFGLIDLQILPDALTDTECVLPFLLPREPNTVVRGEQVNALWIGPGHWLVQCPVSDELTLQAALQESGGHRAAATVVTDAFTLLRLSGPRADEVLEQGCPLDMKALTSNRCARSLLSRAPVLLARTPDQPGFYLWVDRSYGDYLRQWLQQAAAVG